MATLFGKHKVKPVARKGETDERARERVRAMAGDAWTSGVALKMRRPDAVPLVWEAR